MLALLLMAATGAWAQTYTVKFEANGNTVTKENVTLPHTFSCDYWGENGELDQIIKQLYGLGSGFCYDNSTPSASGNSNVTAGLNGNDHYITISAPFEGTATVKGEYSDYSNTIYYSLTISFDVATVAIELDETADNTSTLESNDGKKANVTLTRMLQTGSYNTFAVPFSMTIPSGWTVKELSSASVSEGVLTLNFADAESIEAGKPYLVKVTSPVENPTFDGVTISKTAVPFTSTDVDFIPTLGATTIEGDVASILFLGSGNTLRNPDAENSQMKGFRAYFQLKGESLARAFVLNFGDGETSGIRSLTPDPSPKGEGSVYTLDGRKLQGQPTQKGVYIVRSAEGRLQGKNGKKFIK